MAAVVPNLATNRGRTGWAPFITPPMPRIWSPTHQVVPFANGLPAVKVNAALYTSKSQEAVSRMKVPGAKESPCNAHWSVTGLPVAVTTSAQAGPAASTVHPSRMPQHRPKFIRCKLCLGLRVGFILCLRV